MVTNIEFSKVTPDISAIENTIKNLTCKWVVYSSWFLAKVSAAWRT